MAIEKYQNRITSQYRDKDKFMAWLTSALNILNDCSDISENSNVYFDLDNAIGKQQDINGEIIGVSRELPFNPANGDSPKLTDEMYRLIIKCKIAKNTWQGTIQEIYEIFENIFPELKLVIDDKQNMSFNAIIYGNPSELQQILIQNDYIIPRPEGVKLNIVTASEVEGIHYPYVIFRENKFTILEKVKEPI